MPDEPEQPTSIEVQNFSWDALFWTVFIASVYTLLCEITTSIFGISLTGAQAFVVFAFILAALVIRVDAT